MIILMAFCILSEEHLAANCTDRTSRTRLLRAYYFVQRNRHFGYKRRPATC